MANGDTIVYDVVAEASHPNNERPFLQIRVHKGNSGLGVVLQFHAESGTVHAWNHTHLSNDVGNWGQDFQAAQPTWLQGNPYYGIQQPACSNSVIAIGAYSSESLNSVGTEVGGTLAYFSSYGPTLDGRLKPNVSAPGVSVESSLSSFRDGTYTVTSTAEFDGMTYDFAKLSGTSMSSPATAGVVALMLEANPTLTAGDVRDLLEQTAREDNDTGALPSEGDWVWGAWQGHGLPSGVGRGKHGFACSRVWVIWRANKFAVRTQSRGAVLLGDWRKTPAREMDAFGFARAYMSKGEWLDSFCG